ncbi:MAG: c-type cytochrome [Chloroflexi bacterium]|nr:c-type cytochrome [Chloroflexota bacterium]
MKRTSKLFKWIGLVLGSLLGLICLALIIVYVLSNARLNKSYTIPAVALTIPTDTSVIAEGKRQFMTRGCVDCHGDNGAGKPVIDDPVVGRIVASNLTAGKNGIGQQYRAADWERSIRHGVAPDGKPLIVMPSQEFYPISDDDLATLVAYIKSLPPVDSAPRPRQVGPLGRILLVGELVPVLPAEHINHTAPRPQVVTKGATAAYGEYLAKTCAGCHGQGLSGGPIPGMPADPPYPRNLTPDVATGLGSWTEADFFQAIREGKRPDGTTLSTAMPWQAFKVMTDEELRALWLYLGTVPAKTYGNR